MQAAADKAQRYELARRQLAALIEGVDDPVAAMASCCSVLHEALDYTSWTGFYRVVEPGLLRVGPYQGPPGCIEIRFGDGVCGVAAADEATQLVPDVHAFPGHIACDARTRSEIVVPVRGRDGRLAAVLDLDSHRPAAFDELDRAGLEAIAELLAGRLDTPPPG